MNIHPPDPPLALTFASLSIIYNRGESRRAAGRRWLGKKDIGSTWRFVYTNWRLAFYFALLVIFLLSFSSALLCLISQHTNMPAASTAAAEENLQRRKVEEEDSQVPLTLCC